MRAVVAVAMAWVAFGCGHGGAGSGGGGATMVALQISTAGPGVVRGAGQDCRGACNFSFPKGTAVELTAVADSGARFSGWSGACSAAGSCSLTLTSDTSVTATFGQSAPGSHLVSVTVEGSGRVLSDPAGIDCSAGTCTAPFPDGARVGLTATAAPGFAFAGFGGACSGPGGCVVVVAADAHVFAHFDPAQAAVLTVSVEGPGKVDVNGTTCTSTCQMTVTPGTTVSLTATAGADARFDGWSGACSGAAACSVTVSVPIAVHARFEPLAQTLVPADGTAVPILALNSTSVYYARLIGTAYSIWSVPKTGGTPAQISDGAAVVTIVADDAFVYWTDSSSIFSAPVSGGQASRLATSTTIGGLALDSDGALFWVQISDSTHIGSIHRMQNRADAVIVANAPSSYGLALDDTFVYFTTTGLSGGVDRARKDGTGIVTFLGGVGAEVRLARVDSNYVYFRAISGGVWSIAKSDGKLTHVSSGNPDFGMLGSLDFDVNASVVYWNWNGPNGTPQGLFRGAPDGSGQAIIDPGADGGLRVDDTAIYYFRNGALVRRLKP